MCDLPGVLVCTERGWGGLQWAAGGLFLCSGGEARPVRPLALGRRRARVLSSRKVIEALKAFCAGKPSSVHLGAPLPLQESECNVAEQPATPPPPPARPETVSCGVQTDQTESRRPEPEADLETEAGSEAEPCLELVVDEEDVRLFRQWLATARTKLWDVDLERFDSDEVYKEQMFYLINPLVRLERCPLILELVSGEQARGSTVAASSGDPLTVQQFADRLGLKVARKPHGSLFLSSSTSTSDSEDSLFDKHAARLRLRSARLTRAMRSKRRSDIENRSPTKVKQPETRNKTKHNPPTKNNTTNTSPTKHNLLGFTQKSNSSSTRHNRANVGSERLQIHPGSNRTTKHKESPVKHNRRVSVSSDSSEERSNNKTKRNNDKLKRLSRSKSRSPIRLKKSDTSLSLSKPKATKLGAQQKAGDSSSRSRSPTRLRKPDTPSKLKKIQKHNRHVISDSSEKRSKNIMKEQNDKLKRRSRSKSRSPIRLNKSTKLDTQRDSTSRSRSPMRLRKSDTSSKHNRHVSESSDSSEEITNNRKKQQNDKLKRRSRSKSRSPISLRKLDISPKPQVAKFDKQRKANNSPSRSRSPMRLRKSDTSSKPKQLPNKIDKVRKSKSRSKSPTRLRKSDTSSKPKQLPNKIDKVHKSKSRSKSPIRLKKSDSSSKPKQIGKQIPNKEEKYRKSKSRSRSRSPTRSPIQLRKSLPSRSPVKSDKPAVSTVKAVRSATSKDSRSQISVKSVSSGGSKKAKGGKEKSPNNNNNKPPTSSIGASWKMPKFLYRKSSVRPGREYSSFEDQALVAWLSADECRARRVNGNALWRNLEADWLRIGGVARSWHSLRNRYLRYVLPSLQALAVPQEQAGKLRAAAATGLIKGSSGAPPRPAAPSPRGAYRGVARCRLRQAGDLTATDDSSPATKRTEKMPKPADRSEPDAVTSHAGPSPSPAPSPAPSPSHSPSYESVTRRFALRSSNTTEQGQASPPRHTRRLYNPRPM